VSELVLCEGAPGDIASVVDTPLLVDVWPDPILPAGRPNCAKRGNP